MRAAMTMKLIFNWQLLTSNYNHIYKEKKIQLNCIESYRIEWHRSWIQRILLKEIVFRTQLNLTSSVKCKSVRKTIRIQKETIFCCFFFFVIIFCGCCNSLTCHVPQPFIHTYAIRVNWSERCSSVAHKKNRKKNNFFWKSNKKLTLFLQGDIRNETITGTINK